MTEIAKVLSTIDLDGKHSWAISNNNMDKAKNLRLISIKKYWRCICQIQDKID